MSELIIEKQGAITILTLNRPQRHNAINTSMSTALREAVADFDQDLSQQVLIVTGSGPKAFCAGADLKGLGGEDGGGRRAPRSKQPDIGGLAACEKPVIAAINGFAVGGGLEIALCCDIRLAVEDAWFGLPEASRGFIAGVAAVVLPRIIGVGATLDMMLTGERVGAPEAFRLGLVQKVMPTREALMAEAMRKAELMCGLSRAALMGTKRIVRFARDLMLAEQQVVHDMVAHRVLLTGDFMEGIDAFREKRAPRFSKGWPDPLKRD
ncbi:MAG: enoyl-CoA hydratase/isomerase family protein [Rhodospirillaceae bacterium]|nr:MAG: enoyl-CoA hydratase/isomerase family protein [Rhodospirillaceae bacterium]